MTGEITLRGRVLPIGGLKQKILAAHLAGAKMVMLPQKNEKDLRDIPEEIRKQMKLVMVDSMEQVLANALRRKPAPLKAPPAEVIDPNRPLDEHPAAPDKVRRGFPASSLRPRPATIGSLSASPPRARRLHLRRAFCGMSARREIRQRRLKPGGHAGLKRFARSSALALRRESGVPRLLRDAGRAEDGHPGRHQEGLPQARPQAPPRRQQGRSGGRAALQGGERGQRGPLRPREAQALRPAGLKLGGISAGGRRVRHGGGRSARARSRGFRGAAAGGGPVACATSSAATPKISQASATSSEPSSGAPQALPAPADSPGRLPARRGRVRSRTTARTATGEQIDLDDLLGGFGGRRPWPAALVCTPMATSIGRACGTAASAARRGGGPGDARGGRQRHQATGPGRRSPPRGDDPQGRRGRPPDPALADGRQRPERRPRLPRRARAAAPRVHAERCRPDARPADHARRGAARRERSRSRPSPAA